MKMGVTIPESRLSRYEEDVLMIIDDEIERMKAGTINNDRARQRAATREQAVGEYCEGADIAECRAVFGDALNQVCMTCPD